MKFTKLHYKENAICIIVYYTSEIHAYKHVHTYAHKRAQKNMYTHANINE